MHNADLSCGNHSLITWYLCRLCYLCLDIWSMTNTRKHNKTSIASLPLPLLALCLNCLKYTQRQLYNNAKFLYHTALVISLWSRALKQGFLQNLENSMCFKILRFCPITKNVDKIIPSHPHLHFHPPHPISPVKSNGKRQRVIRKGKMKYICKNFRSLLSFLMIVAWTGFLSQLWVIPQCWVLLSLSAIWSQVSFLS